MYFVNFKRILEQAQNRFVSESTTLPFILFSALDSMNK